MLKLAVIGAGPVGCVQALMLRKHGYSVDLYEYRKDIRGECEATYIISRKIYSMYVHIMHLSLFCKFGMYGCMLCDLSVVLFPDPHPTRGFY